MMLGDVDRICIVDFTEILKTIRQWNQQQLLLHPRTCLEILKLIRKEVLGHVDVITSRATESCQTSAVDGDVPAVRQLNIVQDVYNEVAAAGFLGKTLFELQVCCTSIVNIVHGKHLAERMNLCS